MKITTEVQGLNGLRAVLDDAPESAHENVVKAVRFTAFGIKKTAQDFASGIAHAPSYPRSITYEVRDRGVGRGAYGEIGPDKDRRQGALGNILEYGTVNNAPFAHLGPALDRWSPDLEDGLGKAVADALEGKT